MIAVLRASRASALVAVCDVLVEEGILSLELTLTTPDCSITIRIVSRYANTAAWALAPCWTHRGLEGHRLRRPVPGAPTMNLPVIDLAVRNQIAVFPVV